MKKVQLTSYLMLKDLIFPPNIRKKRRVPTLPLLFNIVLKDLANNIRQEKK